MTRRSLLALLPAAGLAAADVPIVVPVHHVIDSKAQWTANEVSWFRLQLWPEAALLLGRCGVQFENTFVAGEIARPPGREPVITGLERGVLNFVVTDRIPMSWDGGRGICGVTTQYRGYYLCMVALALAHGNQIPFLSVNTCLHEVLHALLGDIFDPRPPGVRGLTRELGVDARATRMWLFHDGGAIRQQTRDYLERLRSAQ